MTRPLFTLMAAASFALCAAAAVVWLQSYGYWDELRLGQFQRDAVSYTALSYDGQLRLARFRNDGGSPGPRAWGWNGAAYPPGWQSPPDTMRWANRPTFQQVVSFANHRRR